MSRCGHLGFRDEQQTLWFASPELEDPSPLSHGPISDAAFAPDGSRLIYQESAGERTIVQSLGDGERLELPGRAGQLRVVQPLGSDARVLACRESGLEILSSELTPIARVDGVCGTLISVPRGRFALLPLGETARAVDSLNGAARSLATGSAWPNLKSDEFAHAELTLSSDSELVLHRQQLDELCGDTMCGVKANLTALSAASGAAVVKLDVSPNACCGGLGKSHMLGAPTIGHALLIDAFENMIFVDPGLHTHVFTDVTPLHLDASEQRALIRRDGAKNGEIAWVKLPSGETLSSFERALDDGWAVAQDGSRVAVGQLSERCVRHPTGDSCHTQIWQLSVAAGGNPRSVAESAQPLTAHWVGSDGMLLVTGAVALGPFPERSDPGELPAAEYGTHLLAADGARIGSHELGQVLEVWDASESLLIKTWIQLPDGYQQALYAISRTGAQMNLLASGDEIEVHLDEARSRIAATIRKFGAATDRELWAGAVPVP
jgi:hypothetical protein